MNTAFGNHCDQSEMKFGNVENNRLVMEGKKKKKQNSKLKMFKKSLIWGFPPLPFQYCDFSICNSKEDVSCLAAVHRDNIPGLHLNRGTPYTFLHYELLLDSYWLEWLSKMQQDCDSKTKWVHHVLRGILRVWFGGYGRKLADVTPGNWHLLRHWYAAKQI